jgi:hypothetical protein
VHRSEVRWRKNQTRRVMKGLGGFSQDMDPRAWNAAKNFEWSGKVHLINLRKNESADLDMFSVHVV